MRDTLLDIPLEPGAPAAPLPPVSSAPQYVASQQPASAEAAARYAADPWLLAVVLSLLGFGVVMVYSASAMYAEQKFHASDYFLRRELIWATLGLAAMAVSARLDYGFYKKRVYPLLGVAFALLVAVLVVGARINGARRWFHFGPISFQPAELAKLAVVFYLSLSLAKKSTEKMRTFTVGFLPHIAVAGAVMLLLLKQPDLGTAVILGLTTLLMLFVAGARITDLLIAFLAAAPVVYQVIVGTPWRLFRMLAFIDPWPYRYTVGYQITESLIAVGSGGVFGVGLGDSKQKLLFLPEAHTDYILAIVGEELGYVGLLCIAASFSILVWRGVRAALRARDAFGCYLAFGITALFALQAMVNMGVVLGSLPTKGLPLPFVSFGGSTLVVDLLAAGVLLNISRAAPEAAPALQPSALFVQLLAMVVPSRLNRRRGQRVRVVTPKDAPGAAAGTGF